MKRTTLMMLLACAGCPGDEPKASTTEAGSSTLSARAKRMPRSAVASSSPADGGRKP